MTVPRVTVGLVLWGAAAGIDGVIRSIRAQGRTDFELLIADASCDTDTAELCRAHAGEDPRIQHRRSDGPRSLAECLNELVASARGEFFKLVTQNETLAPDFLSRCLDAFAREPAAVVLVYPKTRMVGPAGEARGVCEDRLDLRAASPARRLAALTLHMRQNNVIHGLVRTSALRDARLLLPGPGFDKLLVAELALRGEFREIPDVLRLRWPAAPARGAPVPRVRFAAARLVLAHLGAIRRAPLTSGQKLAAAAGYLPAEAAARLRHAAYGLLARPASNARRLLRQVVRGAAARGEP